MSERNRRREIQKKLNEIYKKTPAGRTASPLPAAVSCSPTTAITIMPKRVTVSQILNETVSYIEGLKREHATLVEEVKTLKVQAETLRMRQQQFKSSPADSQQCEEEKSNTATPTIQNK
jgi:FtsZ-binding cell division protein ZapB